MTTPDERCPKHPDGGNHSWGILAFTDRRPKCSFCGLVQESARRWTPFETEQSDEPGEADRG